jgi:molecular chaperone DnaK
VSDPQRGIFGIDLGTTYSVVGYVDETGRAAVTRNSEGFDTTPSVVYFESEGNVVVGRTAMAAAGDSPEQVVSLIKREMGERDYQRTFFGVDYSPPAISAIILKALAQEAEDYTGRKVTDAVITVPAYFGLLEKDATRKAGEIAGLNVIGIVPEPVAAALHYGVTGSADGTSVLVYDLGGATFDISLIRMTETSVEVLVVGGDHRLGGADWDAKLLDHLVDQTIAQRGDDSLRDDEPMLHALRIIAEGIKKALSSAESKTQIVRYTAAPVKITVTRGQFEEMTAELLEETIRITKRTLAEAEERYPGVTQQISEVLLVGGSSRMPAVKAALKKEFGWDPMLADPDLAVARGAALYATGYTVRQLESDVGSTDEDERVWGSVGSVAEVFGAAIATSALVPFVQALAAKAADDVYSSLRRLRFRIRPRPEQFSPHAGAVISVVDESTKLVLKLPASLGPYDQEALYRLLESLTRNPSDSGPGWLQISKDTEGTGWNVRLVNSVPPGSIVLERPPFREQESPAADRGSQTSAPEQQLMRIAELEKERKVLRRMVKYLAGEIDSDE